MTGHGFTTEEERSIRARMPMMNPFIRKVYKLMLENNLDYTTAETLARASD